MNNAAALPFWHLRMLGELCVSSSTGDRTITRFRTQKTALLLAYLAYFPDKPHPREVLTDLLWPEATSAAGRHNLCNALAALRGQLEPSGIVAGSVLRANRFSLQLNPGAMTSDVARFHEALRLARSTQDVAERRHWLKTALDTYGGLLLPGFYEDWLPAEQRRLQEQYCLAVRGLADLPGSDEPVQEALEYAHRAVRLDPMQEESRTLLIELLIRTDQRTAAHWQSEDFSRLTGTSPSRKVQRLLQPDEGGDVASSPTGPGLSEGIPHRLTRFFGRENERKRLREILLSPETRLLTLTGPGGIGKTRLALEVARTLPESFAGGVRFIELADLTDAGRLYATIWEHLRPQQTPSQDLRNPETLLDRIAERLSGSSFLLVLDNFEHLIEGGTERLRTLLQRLPTLTCLVTSRQRIPLSFEKVFPVDTLPLPDKTETESIDRCDSVQLFADRAQAVLPDFRVTGENARVLSELCNRLEGIPLALELAAAWTHLFTPEQMLQQMNRRFDFLKDRKHDIVPRHQTLRATLDWSYNSLPENVQRFFTGLSVFRGGWTVEQAAQVCEEMEALSLLSRLHASSLLQTVEVAGERRFRMLETIRDYADERLLSQERERRMKRHEDVFLTLAETLEPELTGPEAESAMARLRVEHDNLRAVMDRARHGDPTVGLRLGVALRLFRTMHGYLTEGRQHMEELLASSAKTGAVSPLLRAKALYTTGYMAQEQGDYNRASDLQEASLALYRESAYLPGIAATLRSLGVLARRRGNAAEAISLYQESLQLHREIGDVNGEAALLNSMGIAVFRQGDPIEAELLYERSLALYRRLNDAVGIAQVLNNLGDLKRRQGETTQAIVLLKESVALHRRASNLHGIASALNSLASAYLKQDDPERAMAACWENLLLLRQTRRTWGVCEGLEGFAEIAFRRRQFELSTRLFAAASALRETMNTPLGPSDQAHFAEIHTALFASLGQTAFDRTRTEGKAMNWEQAVDHALENTTYTV